MAVAISDSQFVNAVSAAVHSHGAPLKVPAVARGIREALEALGIHRLPHDTVLPDWAADHHNRPRLILHPTSYQAAIGAASPHLPDGMDADTALVAGLAAIGILTPPPAPMPTWADHDPEFDCTALAADAKGRWHQCTQSHAGEVPSHAAQTPDGELRWSDSDPDTIAAALRTVITAEQDEDTRNAARHVLKTLGVTIDDTDLGELLLSVLGRLDLLQPPGAGGVPEGVCTALRANEVGEWWHCGLDRGHTDDLPRTYHDAGDGGYWYEGDPDTVLPR